MIAAFFMREAYNHAITEFRLLTFKLKPEYLSRITGLIFSPWLPQPFAFPAFFDKPKPQWPPQ